MTQKKLDYLLTDSLSTIRMAGRWAGLAVPSQESGCQAGTCRGAICASEGRLRLSVVMNEAYLFQRVNKASQWKQHKRRQRLVGMHTVLPPKQCCKTLVLVRGIEWNRDPVCDGIISKHFARDSLILSIL